MTDRAVAIRPVADGHRPDPSIEGRETSLASPGESAPEPPPPTWYLATWIAGPDAGRSAALASGVHLVGRSSGCRLRTADRAVEAHHAQILIEPDGVLAVEPLGGPLTRHDHGPVTTIELGASLLRIEPAVDRHGESPIAAAHIVRGQLRRTPRRPRVQPPPPVEVPDQPPPEPRQTTGLLPAVLGLAGAGVIALVTRQPMFLLFGGLGALVAVGSWAAQRTGERRRRRRATRHAEQRHHGFVAALAEHHRTLLAIHRQSTITVSRAAHTVAEFTEELWQRRAADSDCWRVSLGIGSVAVEATLSAALAPGDMSATLVSDGEAVAIDLGPGARCAVRSATPDATPEARAVVRAIICQLLAATGPADLRLAVVTDTPEAWRWLAEAPHIVLPGGPAIVAAAQLADVIELITGGTTEPTGRHVLLLTDQPELLASRTSPLRRALATSLPDAGLLVVVDHHGGLPQLCTAAVNVGRSMLCRWTPSVDQPLATVVHAAGLGVESAAELVARLASLTDPDDPLAADARLPSSIELPALIRRAGVDPFSAASIAAGWVASGADPRLAAPVGVSTDGSLVEIDLGADGPHALLAGTTGAGKSELLRSLVVGWAALSSPDHVAFVLVDYKGGSTFDACAALPHVTGVITDLDDQLADRALRSLHAELRRREAILRHHRATDLGHLRATTGSAQLPRLVVVVDEFAALVSEQPTFLHALVGIAQRGRSLGVHLLLATQRPNGVISDDIRANTTLRLALRLLDREDAMDVVGDPGPVAFARQTPGRAMLRLGPQEHIVFQSAYGATAQIAESISQAADLVGATRPPAPWQPPLPERLAAQPAPVLGLVDDPDGQRVEQLTWSPGDGSVLVAGRRGSGVTGALHSILRVTLARVLAGEHPVVHVAVIDAHGSADLAVLEDHPLCAGVIALQDTERLRHLLMRNAARVHRRRAAASSADARRQAELADEPRWLLVIDGLEVLRQALDDVDGEELRAALDLVITHGPAAGITVVAGTQRLGALPPALLGGFAQSWVGQLADPLDAANVGLSGADRAAAVSGRFVLSGRRLHAQLGVPEPIEVPDLAGLAGLTGNLTPAAAITALPTLVDAASLGRADAGGGTTWIPVGQPFEPGADAALTVPDGSHVMVLGPPRSGRTTAVAMIAEQWRVAHPTGRVVTVAPRRGAFLADVLADVLATVEPTDPGSPEPARLLLTVDDAELVDDDGRLAALLARRPAGFTVVAAAAADPLRRLYGHWTVAVRGNRLGLLAAGCADADGDLLSVTLPRRAPLAPRPGLMWTVDNGTIALCQVATPTP